MKHESAFEARDRLQRHLAEAAQRNREREEKARARQQAIQAAFATEGGQFFIEEWDREREALVADMLRTDPRDVTQMAAIQSRIYQLDDWLKRAKGIEPKEMTEDA